MLSVLNILHILTHSPCKVGIIIIPIVQMKKLCLLSQEREKLRLKTQATLSWDHDGKGEGRGQISRASLCWIILKSRNLPEKRLP